MTLVWDDRLLESVASVPPTTTICGLTLFQQRGAAGDLERQLVCVRTVPYQLIISLDFITTSFNGLILSVVSQPDWLAVVL